jgi:hypothetical protein
MANEDVKMFINIKAVVTLNKNYPVTQSEYGTLMNGFVLSDTMINIVFSMLQQKFKNCLFINSSFSESIRSTLDLPTLQTNIFLRTFILFSIKLEENWVLCSADMKNKKLFFLGLQLAEEELQVWTKSILEWFSNASDNNDFDISEWKALNLVESSSVQTNNFDSGVYTLLCAYCLGQDGCYLSYDYAEVARFRAALDQNLKLSTLPEFQVSNGIISFDVLAGMMSRNEM